jgi:MFS family permease
MSAALAQTIAPLLAGFLLLMIGLEGILSLNLITFLLGSFSFIAIFTSSRKIVANEEKPSVTNVSDVFLVFKYFRTSVYQAGFIIYLAVQNFIISMVAILTLPLMMALFAETELGIMMTFTSFGALVGGALIFILTPKKLVKTILICNFILGVLVAILGTSVWLPLMLICGFSITLFGPLIDSCEKSYWQLYIPKNMLGRFFSFRAAVDLCSFPAAAVISGIIVDQIFAPGMLPGGSLVPFFGDIIGVGEGRGIGVIFFLAGAIYALIAIIVLSMKRRTTQVMNTLTEV